MVWTKTYSVRNDALVYVYLEHVLLTSCDEDLARALGGKVHASQIFEVRASVRWRLAAAHYRACTNIRQMPMCEAAPVGVVDALLGDREDTLVSEEKLLNRAVGRRVSAVRGISFEVRSVKGCDPSLGSVSCNALQAGRV